MTASLRLPLLLGLLTAMGPLAIDMYLPALPAMGGALGASPAALQATLMSFYLAMGAGQLVAGPLSDAYGRRPPLLAGLLLFAVAGIGCALAPDVGTLIALRVLQGLGACAAMVTPRAVVRDLHNGADAARLMGLLMTIYSVSPLLAPLIGSWIALAAGWRAVFWMLAATGLAGLALVAVLLPETRAVQHRAPLRLREALGTYRALLADPAFLRPAAMAALTLAGFFIYVAGSPFVLARHYGVSPQGYAILFALNVMPYVAVAQLNGWLARRFSLPAIVRGALVGQLLTAAVTVAVLLAGGQSVAVFQVGLMAVFAFTGVLLPTLFVAAMEGQPQRAGAASALVGTLNFAGGAAGMAVMAPLSDGTPLPLVLGILACTMAAFALSRGRFAAHAARVATP